MAWAITDEAQFVGRSVRVYRDPTVRFGDQGEVGGIRISHMSGIDKPVNVKLTVSQGKKGMFTFHPLVAEVERNEQSGPSAEVVQWADDLIGRIKSAGSVEAVQSIEDESVVVKRRLWLEDAHPELAKRIADAIAEVREPQTGRTDEQHGDEFDGGDQ